MRLNNFEKDWWSDKYGAGCFSGTLPPLAMTSLKESMYSSSFDGNMFHASTECSREYYGYMEGAVLSGEQAAKECIQSYYSAPFGVRSSYTAMSNCT